MRPVQRTETRGPLFFVEIRAAGRHIALLSESYDSANGYLHVWPWDLALPSPTTYWAGAQLRAGEAVWKTPFGSKAV